MFCRLFSGWSKEWDRKLVNGLTGESSPWDKHEAEITVISLIRGELFLRVWCLWKVFLSFQFSTLSFFLPFLISWTYFPFFFSSSARWLSVSDFLSLPPPHPSPLHSLSLFPSLLWFPPSCVVGGGLVTSCCSDHFSRLSHLGQLVAFPAGQQTHSTQTTHT